MGKRERVTPLTEEPAMFFRPALAVRYRSIEVALLLEWAHHLQCVRGFEKTVDSSGRRVVCFRWTPQERNSRFAFLPGLSKLTLRKHMQKLTLLTARGLAITTEDGPSNAAADHEPTPHSAELLSEPQAPLWRFRLQGAGMDWYSVNYAVVEEGSKLFSTTVVDVQFERRPRSERTSDTFKLNVEHVQTERDSRTRALSKEIQEASLLAGRRAEAGENQNQNAEAEGLIDRAVAELAECGVPADAAIDLIERSKGGARQALVMADNARRLRDAGYRFNDEQNRGSGFVIAGTRGNWHRLSDEEVRIRVASQHKPKASFGPNVTDRAQQEKRLREQARIKWEDGQLDELSGEHWETLLGRARAIWAERFADSFPASPRDNARVRAIVRGILFPVEATR